MKAVSSLQNGPPNSLRVSVPSGKCSPKATGSWGLRGPTLSVPLGRCAPLDESEPVLVWDEKLPFGSRSLRPRAAGDGSAILSSEARGGCTRPCNRREWMGPEQHCVAGHDQSTPSGANKARLSPPPPPRVTFRRLLFLYGALDSHPFFPEHVASSRCFLSAAVAGAPAGVVSAFAEPSSWCAGAVLVVAGCAVCTSAAPSSWHIGVVLVVAGVV